MLLLVGTFAFVLFWVSELYTGVIGQIDTYAYPVLTAFYGALTVYLFKSPSSRKFVEVVSVAVMAGYFVISHWFYFIAPDGTNMEGLTFQQGKIVQWYVLIFIAAFVFFDTKEAVLTSIVIYLALALPEVIFLFDGAPDRAQEVSATAIISLVSNPVFIVALWGVSLIKEQAHEAHGQAKTMSFFAARDTLTETLNRRGILQAIKDMRIKLNSEGEPCALILFDVDHFKRINDTQGHDRGDETLISIAKSTQKSLRTEDRLGRWGGEEFLVAAPHLTPDTAAHLAERLRQSLEDDISAPLKNVTASYGVSILKPDEPIEAAIKRADEALYDAKNAGRNRVAVSTD